MLWFAVGVAAVCLLVNIPFGALRARSERYSWRWMLWVHASIPLIVTLRLALGLSWALIPVNIAAAVAGQGIGGWPRRRRTRTDAPA